MARGVDKSALAEQYAAGDSIPMVAERNGVSRSAVRLAALEHGVLRTRADGVRLAARLGRLSGKRAARRFSAEHKSAIRESAIRRGERDANGFSLKPNGYLEVTRGDHKGRGQHCVVAEEMIGRALFPDEVVHHKDRNRSNNDPSNLEVMTRSQHTSLHRKENH